MTWWAWALIGWVVLSVPAAMVVGRTIALAQRRQPVDEAACGLLGDGGEAGESVSRPRGEDDSDGWRASAV